MSSQWPMSHQADSHPAADSATEASLGRDDNAQEEQREHGLPDPQIIDLSAGRDSSTAGPPELLLRQEILQGLTRDSLLVPGLAPADRLFACSKAIPTVVLYDNLGLELYDQITAVEDYYPFATELGILRAKSYEIACRLGGISTASISKRDDDPFLPAEEQREMNGVHSATLIQPGGEVPQCSSSSPVQVTGFPLTIIELGAGSLKKTSHLLGNVARLLQARKGARTGECFSEAKYYALDLQLEQLKSTLSRIQVQKESGVGPQVGRQVQSYGICGTYQQGLEWISKSMTGSNQAKPAGIGQVGSRKAILWLGSSIGNFSPTEAVQFLRDEIGRALDSTTRVLIGIDNCQVPEKVQLAYDDRQGVTKKFILNGITVVARHLGLPEGVFTPEDFDYVSRYNVGMRRNEAYLRARRGMRFEIPEVEAEVGTEDHQTSPLIEIQAGELIMIEKSYKYSADEAYQLFDQAGLRVIQKWSDSPDPVSPTHTLYLVERAAFHFVRTAPWPLTGDHPVSSPAALPVARKEGRSSWQLLLQAWDTVSKFSLFIDGYHLNSPDQSPNTHEKHTTIGSESLQDHLSKNRAGLPSMADWITLWKAWDTVTLEMIPRNMLHQKPIELRHACLFYLGHIPVFADIHLSRYFNVPNTEPGWFAEIFERGIDPNLDDPKKCNDHSPFPEEENQWPSLEEVLCFRDKLRQRLMEVYRGLGKEPGSQIQLTRRLGRVLAMIYEHEAMHLETLLYMLQQSDFVHHPPGFTPPDWDSLAREWDATAEAHSKYSEPIEYSTPQTITIGHDDYEDEDFFHPFSEDHQYGWDNESPSRKVVVKPFKLESATITNQEYLDFVLEGLSDSEPIPDLVIPGSWVYIFNPSGRESEKHQVRVKTIYGRIEFKFAKHWPVQASGSQLERFAKRKGGRLPTADELRVFLSDNPISQSCQNPIGFSNWHPLPARRPRQGADGRWRGGWSGGVWEWSSTTFEPHPNFKPSSLYPGYSKDFFDGQHNVLVGGSWATIPRIAHRQSFVNWYQFKYPYVFAGARVAYSY